MPKIISTMNSLTSQTIINQKGLIKLSFLSFLITLMSIPILLINFPG